ncbi:helix-turn-helix transcriptional regulator [Agrobacterium sp. ES01]|uniref:helix-turn-helix transcriptional regulator n=1 Tax=Agrobacterium sp. ES01 TaxID=3420714 RepID=UPI003D122F36
MQTAPDDSRPLWRLILRDMMGDVETEMEDRLAGTRGLFWAHGGVAITTLYLPEQQVKLSANGLSESGILIIRAMDGPLHVAQQDKHAEAARAEVLFATAGHPLSIALPQGGRLDCAYLPRHALGSTAQQLSAIVMRPIAHDCLPLQLLITYAGYLLQQQRQSEIQAEMMVRHFYQLLPVLAAELADGSERGGAPGRLASIKARITKQLTNSGFCLADIAKAEGVSPRSIQKLLHGEGTTFSRYLLERRLDAAKEALLLRGASASVTQVALDFGFNDPAYFSRAFRKRYGMRPMDLRRSARTSGNTR